MYTLYALAAAAAACLSYHVRGRPRLCMARTLKKGRKLLCFLLASQLVQTYKKLGNPIETRLGFGRSCCLGFTSRISNCSRLKVKRKGRSNLLQKPVNFERKQIKSQFTLSSNILHLGMEVHIRVIFLP